MAYTIIRPKDRREWLRHRESGIGSSEVGTILGVNPYETPYQLWRRKMGIDAPKEETFAMKAGHYLEDAVAQFYKDATGADIIKSSAGDWLIVNEDRPYLRVSPDRTYWAAGEKKSAANKRILECKTTQREIVEDDLPAQWICQLTYQLGVAELDAGALAWLTAGREFGFKELTFDKEFFEYICEEVQRFWVDNIIGKQEPLSMSVSDVILKNPYHVTCLMVEAHGDIADDIGKLKEIKDKISDLEVTKKEIEGDIKMFIGAAEGITYCGNTLATWKTSKDSQKFDEKRFSEEHPEMYNEYLITKQGARILRIK